MKRIALAAVLACAAALAGCSESQLSSGYAEPVDVPVSVRMWPAASVDADCRKRCWITYQAVVTTESVDGVWARNCVAAALDQKGRVVAESAVGLGGPAGGYTKAGRPYHSSGTLNVTVTRDERERIRTFEASCSAYVWHGTVPI